MRSTLSLEIAALLAITTAVAPSHAQDAGAVQKKLLAEFSLTKTTADRSDIVTAGSVLVLHKDGVVMFSTPAAAPPLNIYKDGRLQRNEFKDRLRNLGGRFRTGSSDTTDINNIPHHTFVSGEKFWVTAIDMEQDGAVFTVYSDAINDVRYYGKIKFPYAKNAPPPADDMAKTVEEVITVAPPDDDKGDSSAKSDSSPKGGKQQQPAPSGGSASAAAIAPIAPPPPPPDQPPPPPKTISIGQTKDVVVAAWGQPTKTVKLGTKEIYFYPDMKVTFVGGKVSDVQ